MIPYGTKVIYHAEYGDVECFCGHYNAEDDTYNVYYGWDVTHVPKQYIEVVDWR